MKKNRNFLIFRFGLGNFGKQVKGKDLIALGQSEKRALSTPNAAGKVDLEMKMFFSQILYERHQLDEKCRPVRRARIYNKTWLPKF